MSMFKAVVSRRGMVGDPFLGGLIARAGAIALPGIGKLARAGARFVGSKFASRAGKVVTGAGVALAARDVVKSALPSLPVPQFVGGGRGFEMLPSAEAGRPWPRNKDGSPRRMRRDGKPWKRPSMNFMNGRAVKRAARRLEGAEKLLRRVFSIRHGGSAGRVTPKGKGRR